MHLPPPGARGHDRGISQPRQIARAAATYWALAMGLIAFTVLMLAGQSPEQWAASLFTAVGVLGQGGQLLFALIPWWVTGPGR